jgi:hypothetical protein
VIDGVQGQIGISQIGGDALAEKIAGGIVLNAIGNITLDFHPVPWQAYQAQAGGSISVTVPADCNADLSVHSKEKDITVMIGSVETKAKEEDLSQQLGEGGPSILLSAGGSVFVMGDDFDMLTGFKLNLEDFGDFSDDFSAKTAEQIKDNLGHLENDLRESLAGLTDTFEDVGLTEENLAKISAQIEESSRRVAEKAELAALKAQAKVEKKIVQARRKAIRAQAKVKEFDLGEFLESRQVNQAVNEEERILILKMLQEKKISADEADELLQALEGKK